MRAHSIRFHTAAVALVLTIGLARSSASADHQYSEATQSRREAVAPAPPAGERKLPFNLSAIEAALRANGIAFEKDSAPSGSVAYFMKIVGVKFVLVGYGSEAGLARSMQLAAGFSDNGARSRVQKMDMVNQWNRDRRFVKAYVDRDNDIVLEMDLVAVGAVDPRELVRTISDIWLFEVMAFSAKSP